MTGSKSGGATKGYLYRLLADGAQPFRYRSRVRALLGFPECGGVGVNFAKPLPMAGFSHVIPRFTGEFEFPDELVSTGSRPIVRAEEMTSSSRRTSGSLPPQGEPARGRTATGPISGPGTVHAREGATAERRRTAQRPAGAASGEMRSGEQAHGGNRAGTAPTEIGSAPTGPVPMPPAATATRHAEYRTGPALQVHDVTLPGVQARRDPAAHSGEAFTGEPRQANVMLPASTERAAGSLAGNLPPRATSGQENVSKTGNGVPPAGPSGIPVGHAPHGVPAPIRASSSAPPERPFREVRSVERASSLAAHDLPPAKGAPPRVRTESRPELPPDLRAEGAATRRRPGQAEWDGAGLPSMRRPNRRSHQSGPPEFPQQAPAAAANPVPVAPPAQTPTIVIHSGAGPGVTSPAFWERRHLTNLRLRIRR